MPCNCNDEQAALDAIQADIRQLQWDLTHDDHVNKAATVAQIKALGRQGAAAEHALAVCLTHCPPIPPCRSVFSGQATLTVSGNAPVVQPFSAVFLFSDIDAGHKSFLVNSFSSFSGSVNVVGLRIDLHISISVFNGVRDRQTGEMHTLGIPVATVDYSAPFGLQLASSHVAVPLTTGTAGALTGRPVDAGGQAMLVGVGTIPDGPSQAVGRQVSIQLDGTFSPLCA
jgi:hypothetical protein